MENQKNFLERIRQYILVGEAETPQLSLLKLQENPTHLTEVRPMELTNKFLQQALGSLISSIRFVCAHPLRKNRKPTVIGGRPKFEDDVGFCEIAGRIELNPSG